MRSDAKTRRPDATKVIAYYRCSTDKQTLDAQIADVEGLCLQRGWVIVGTYQDEAVSSRKKRPGQLAALEAMGRGEADFLVIQRLDRLARSLIELASIAERMNKEGWAIVADGQVYEYKSAVGRLIFNQLALFANFERDLIKERVDSGLAEKRKQGIVGGRKGMDKDLEAQIVEWRKQGFTRQAICDALNDAGTPTPYGGLLWRSSALDSIFEKNGLKKRRKAKKAK